MGRLDQKKWNCHTEETALRLREVEGLTVSAIAERLGYSTTSVSSKLRELRKSRDGQSTSRERQKG